MADSNAGGAAPTKLVQPRTKRGRRVLLRREPKLVEDAKRALLLFGTSSSQFVKDAIADLHKLKWVDAKKFTRKNADVQPFEPGGEASLEFFCQKSHCSLFVLGTHTKKRPHNLVLGRMYDFRLLDMVELGLSSFNAMKEFGSAAASQPGNKPCILFAGEQFDSVPELKLLRSLLLDFFRGAQVSNLNLGGLDRVLVAVAHSDKSVHVRQYHMKFKKSGTQVPRGALIEMGPRLDVTLRRVRLAPVELEKEALRQPKLEKKIKNRSRNVDGAIGRMYVPKQDVDNLGLSKMKGLKRERRSAAAQGKRKKTRTTAQTD